MSATNRTFGRDELCTDVAAYALGALEPAEAEAFEHHLSDCEACAEDLAGFEHVLDALAMTAPQHPVPRGLRPRVMGAVRSEPRRLRIGPLPETPEPEGAA